MNNLYSGYELDKKSLTKNSNNQNYINYLVTKNVTNTDILRLNNFYYDKYTHKKKTCYFDNIYNLVYDINNLKEGKLNIYSLFNENKYKEIYSDCENEE